MPFRSLLLLVLLLAALSGAALAALAQEETDADAAAAPSASGTVLASGWRVYEQPSDGYSVTLPPTWRRIDLDPATVAASIDASGVADPDTAAWLGEQVGPLVASQVSFFGFDFSPSSMQSGFATNANVIHTQLPAAIPLTTLVQISIAQLENLPAVQGAVSHRSVSLAAGRAEQFMYHLMSGGQALALTQYLFARATDSYVLTLTTTDEQASGYADSFDQIGKSFQIVG